MAALGAFDCVLLHKASPQPGILFVVEITRNPGGTKRDKQEIYC